MVLQITSVKVNLVHWLSRVQKISVENAYISENNCFKSHAQTSYLESTIFSTWLLLAENYKTENKYQRYKILDELIKSVPKIPDFWLYTSKNRHLQTGKTPEQWAIFLDTQIMYSVKSNVYITKISKYRKHHDVSLTVHCSEVLRKNLGVHFKLKLLFLKVLILPLRKCKEE